jgi:hypothetical protein
MLIWLQSYLLSINFNVLFNGLPPATLPFTEMNKYPQYCKNLI